MDSGPILGTEENSINDGDLNIMNNKKDGLEGRSQGQLTNCTGFFQNNISNDLLRKQNGSVLDEGTADGANMRPSSASEDGLHTDLKCRSFVLPDSGDPHARNLTQLVAGEEYPEEKGKICVVLALGLISFLLSIFRSFNCQKP